jgi:hypothetical protein
LGEAARYELVQRNLLLCATKNLSGRRALAVWVQRLVVHAKGIITGPFRLQRIRSIVRATAGLPSALAARRHRPRAASGFDEQAMFVFAAGLSPNFSTDTYRSLD